MDNRPVGIFDSGVGGLTVVEEVRKILPEESIVYFGDTARVPYGGKSRDTLFRYGREIINFLLSKNVKAVIIACGTSSSNIYGELTEAFQGLPMIDVILPGVRACLEANPKKIGFIATEATIRSGLFERLIKQERPDLDLFSKACPLFAPMAEEGWTNHAVTRLVAEIYLEDWKNKSIDTFVLGCTHYPLLMNILKDVLGSPRFINMAEYTALAAKSLLNELNLINNGVKPPEYKFFTSGYTEKFDRMAGLFLKIFTNAVKVDLE